MEFINNIEDFFNNMQLFFDDFYNMVEMADYYFKFSIAAFIIIGILMIWAVSVSCEIRRNQKNIMEYLKKIYPEEEKQNERISNECDISD